MAEWLVMTGPAGYLLLLLALGAAGAAVVALGLAAATRAFKVALLFAGLAFGFAFLGVVGGVMGRTMDLRGSYRAVVHASPDDRQLILDASRQEAQANVFLGLFSVPGLLLAAAAVGTAFSRTGAAR